MENTNTGTSVYILDGTPGNCFNAVTNGIFQVGIALDATNSVAIQVNVTTPGTYFISSNTINGISFYTNGTFTTTGTQTIILTASGIPVANGTYDFNIGNTGGCNFSVTCSI